MKISIVCPTFNRPAYFKRMLDSVMIQDHKNWELVVIDENTATDETVKIIETTKDGRIKYIVNDDRKVSTALNKGFKACTGELVTLLCDDDELLGHNSLSARHNMFEDLAEYGIEFLYCSAINQKVTGEYINDVNALPVSVYNIWKTYHIDTMAMMWKRDLFKRIGYWNTDIQYADDQEWKCRCLMEACCIGRDFKVVKHSQHLNQISRINKANGKVQAEKAMFKKNLFEKYKDMFVC